MEFGGWEMPVQYTTITDEHLNVRQAAGVFDISHMGEFLVSGEGAESVLNACLTNDVRKLAPGGGQYTLMCNDQGGVIDDLYLYRLSASEYLLIVNASRIDADEAWLRGQLARSGMPVVRFENASDMMGALAIQGPKVKDFIDHCFKGPATAGTNVAKPTELKKNQVCQLLFAGNSVWIARTGYTGEDGFEVVAPADSMEHIWEKLLDAGRTSGLKPAGLGARDTLRTEMCYPLYGHELDEQTTPLEAGLGFFVALDKGDFAGRNVLVEQKSRALPRKLAAFKMAERSAPPRPGYSVWSGHQRLGTVTSGTQSPSLNLGIALGYLPLEFSRTDTPIQVEIRGRKSSAVVVSKPIYRKA